LDELQPGDALIVKLGQHQGKLQTLQKPLRQHGNQVMPQFPTHLNEEFAFFMGYMVGDGFIAAGADDHRVGVTVAHDSYLMEEMPVMMRRLFGEHITIHTQQKPNDASVTFVIDNRAVKDFFILNNLVKSRSTSAHIPRPIRQSTPEILGAFISGLFEADGALSHGYPSLLSSSETLIRETATALIGLGCPVTLRPQPMTDNHYGTTQMWMLRLNSYVSLQSWRKLIGCDTRSRFNICYTFEPDLSRESSYVLPHPAYWIEPVLTATAMPQMDKKGRGTGRNLRATDPKLRKQMLRYTRGDRQLTLSGYVLMAEKNADFAQHARPIENTWFTTIVSVESAGESLTLDIEVEQNHTYLANGLVTHNSRRGANMAVLRVDHPDVREFITCKTDESNITNFNISVGISDAFMRAVETDSTYDLINPQDGKVWETVRAREIFDLIVKQAHHNGEPGVLFLDAANRQNPVPHLYELESTNPCGEQFLGPFENCCLGSINLVNVNTPDGKVNWAQLQELVETSTRFLDDVVTANKYVPAVPQLEEAAHAVRRIGLGIMGLGDLMYKCGIRYGSEEGQEFAGQVMEFVRFHAMKTSIALAQERGPFPAIKGSIYDPENMKWQPPKPLFPYSRNLHRPALDWTEIVAGIKQYGIRNGCQTTVAPTGTIATVSGCEAYGCEPVFALAYIRHVNDKGQDLKLQYTSPLFQKALEDAGLDAAQIKTIVEQVNIAGSCQNVPGVPENVRHTFVVSADVSVEEHIRMQAAMQAFVDNAISKTINAPDTATLEDVKTAYMMGWKLGCKGMTVYVTGSREKVVLETHATAQAKQKDEQPVQAAVVAAAPIATVSQPAPMKIYGELKKPRARRLAGRTYQIGTPVGKTYITINENGEGRGQPFEIFTHTSKAGSETAAVSEAIGRLISLVLRIASPISPRERLGEIVQQLVGIGGGRSSGFGAARVRSLPDGVAQALQEYLEETSDMENLDEPVEITPLVTNAISANAQSSQAPAFKSAVGVNNGKIVGDLCPECGEATLINEEGCRKCYTCSYSEC
jgi:ribonucleoside-diphosphate reductase alpha chain